MAGEKFFDQIKLLSIATLGGLIFNVIGLPAPWLSGAMFFSGIFVATGYGRALAAPLRDLAMISSGITLGASVTAETMRAFVRVPVSLVLLIVTSVSVMIITGYMLQWIFKWSRRDAMLASAPGALSSILAIAIEEKADIARIAIIQLFRLVTLVTILPPLIMSSQSVQMMDLPPSSGMDPVIIILTFIAGILGIMLAKFFKFSVPFILGPMLFIGALRAFDLLPGLYPPALSSAGFLLIGTFIGGRFQGVKRSDIIKIAPAAFLSFTLTTGIAAAGAMIDTNIVGIPFAESLIAFAPGGLEAMTALAFALHVEPVIVGVHHLARFILIGAGLPLIIRLWPSIIRNERSL